MTSATYENPVHPSYLADPFVFRHEGTYFAIGTGAQDASGMVETSTAPSVFPILRSNDLTAWSEVGAALIRPAAALGHTFWAPEIVFHETRFYLYYSVGFDDRSHHLRVATSAAPEGPYVDAGVALTDVRSCPFAIDPHPFRDRDGRYYLFHARDFLDVGGASGVRAGTALVVAELETMTRLSERVDTVLRARFDWQRYRADREMYGRRFDWHTLEGPCVLERDGVYYCLYSGGAWHGASYGVDFAVARSVRGPYSDEGGEHGPRVLRSAPGHLLGPGHNSVVFAPDGVTPVIAYHAWDPSYAARRLCVDRLVWTSEGPGASGATRGRRSLTNEP
jgi:beta-xylosidase